MPIGNRSGRTTESLTDITKSVPRIPAPKTYLERWGIIQMSVLIGVICLVCFTMIAMWWSTRPTYADCAALFAAGRGAATQPVTPEQVVELVDRMQSRRAEQYRGMIQLVVLSVLVPLFTLIAGYVFGKARPHDR